MTADELKQPIRTLVLECMNCGERVHLHAPSSGALICPKCYGTSFRTGPFNDSISKLEH